MTPWVVDAKHVRGTLVVALHMMQRHKIALQVQASLATMLRTYMSMPNSMPTSAETTIAAGSHGQAAIQR